MLLLKFPLSITRAQPPRINPIHRIIPDVTAMDGDGSKQNLSVAFRKTNRSIVYKDVHYWPTVPYRVFGDEPRVCWWVVTEAVVA